EIMLRSITVGLALALIIGGTSCKKESAGSAGGAGDEGPQAPSATEIERARSARQDYKQRVCAAARTTPSLGEQCKLATPRLEALEMQVRALHSTGEMNDTDRRVVQAALRRLASECIQDASKLAPSSAQ